MIPKIIHYCWFGRNPLPPLALECIASWKKFFPDYEIKEWNEVNFDVNIVPYTSQAYKQGKYAFVSDYARFWAIYHYGGIYFDTDVEVIRPMDDIISAGNFMGFEVDPDGENTPGKYAPRFCFAVNPGVGFGMCQGHPLIKQMLDLYDTLSFEVPTKDITWYKTVVSYTTEFLIKNGLENVKDVQNIEFFDMCDDNRSNSFALTIYPSEYFAPINVITNRLHITENTRSIHRYIGSWNISNVNVNRLAWREFTQIVRYFLPECVLILLNKIKRENYRIF